MNIRGYDSIDTIIERGLHALSPDAFEAAANETRALVLDVRDAEEFAKGFIPNSINIGLDGNFAMWVGEMIPDLQQKILLVTEPGREQEAITRLARVGYDYAIGYLEGGFNAWKAAGKEYETIERISAAEFAEMMRSDNPPMVIDVRKKSEFDSEHLLSAVNIPLNQINQHLSEIPKDKPFVLHCAGGYRSMLAASILKQRGWDNFKDVRGGFKEIAQYDVPKSDYVCPTTLL